MQILLQGIDEGVPLSELSRRISEFTGKTISRQRVHQVCKKFDLIAKRNGVREKVNTYSKEQTRIRFLALRPKGRQVINVMMALREAGYKVTFGRTMTTCAVEGYPVSIHIMSKSWNGRYHTNCARPNTLRICLFPNGKMIMLMPDFKRQKQGLSFHEKLTWGSDILFPPAMIREMLVAYAKKLKYSKRKRL